MSFTTAMTVLICFSESETDAVYTRSKHGPGRSSLLQVFCLAFAQENVKVVIGYVLFAITLSPYSLANNDFEK